MGMVLELTTLADENIERILADPPLIWRVVAPDEPEFYEAARREQAKRRSWSDPWLWNRAIPPSADLDLWTL